ncbi:MAG: GNAT family N-acetyltransferase [Phycisphaerae bacterium]
MRRSPSASRFSLEIGPLTAERWGDLEDLFGSRGACGGCWCMWWRLRRSEFESKKGAGNRRAFKRIVSTGQCPGLLGYVGGRPVAWLALAPRECYSALGRSRILKPVDDQPVWSVTCFFVAKDYRRKGVTVRMLKEAVRYVRERGGTVLEGYPIEPRQGDSPDVFMYVGLASAFTRAGFKEVTRRSPTRPIMRRYIGRRGR